MAVSDGLATTCILLVFLVALAGVLLPLQLLINSPSYALLRCGNAFAAGFLVAASLVHLLPAGDRAFLKLYPNITYPLSGLFALCGAIVVFVVDNVLKASLTKPHQQKDTLLPSPEPHSNPPVSSSVITYVLAVTLSLHSLIEGLTLGASIFHKAQFMALLIAILTHKLFAALSLGSSLATLGKTGQVGAIISGLVFASLTPIGALIGWEVVKAWGGAWITAGLTCVSAGIFLYVGLVELLAHEFRQGGRKREVGIFLGAAAGMSLLAMWT